MVTVKKIVKKLFTLDGMLKIVISMFLLNMTVFGRTILAKIKTFFARGMGGI